MKRIFLVIVLSFLFVPVSIAQNAYIETVTYHLDLEKGNLTITALPKQINEVIFEPGLEADWEVKIHHTTFLLDTSSGTYACVRYPSMDSSDYGFVAGGFIYFLGSFPITISSTKESRFCFFIMNDFEIPMEVEISLQ